MIVTANFGAVFVPDFLFAPKKYGPSPQQIIKRVAERHGFTVEDITGQRRSTDHIAARFEAIDLVRTFYGEFSLSQIGRIFGKRDHATILHALRRIDDMKKSGIWQAFIRGEL